MWKSDGEGDGEGWRTGRKRGAMRAQPRSVCVTAAGASSAIACASWPVPCSLLPLRVGCYQHLTHSESERIWPPRYQTSLHLPLPLHAPAHPSERRTPRRRRAAEVSAF